MSRAAGLGLPHSVIAVYDGLGLFLLALAGVAVAGLGSLLPAGWAARNPLATLRVMRWVTCTIPTGSLGRLTWTTPPRASNSPPPRKTCCANSTRCTVR
ncbi:hypothetical protein [Streptomyces sp. NBC_01239]|uniref:hypothetical protein n=1 Tax=Streptomyces sp. NBC_01239 TaxID=2903792 RepID=UPI002254043D|nr:hypothetical protein [Streptomyces sp. NBC_01239]